MTTITRTARPAAAAALPRRRAKKRRDGRAALVFLAPWLLGILLVTAGPLLASLYLSFTQYNLISAPVWVGFSNFIALFNDPNFLASAGATLIYVVVSVPLVLVLALLLASALNAKLRGMVIYRTLFYIPTLLGASVAIAVLWSELFSTNGAVNNLLSIFHITGLSWLGDPSTALYTLVALNVWTFGGTMVIFLAGLRQIPVSLYEAAELDGAGRWRKFTSVTFPTLSPVIFFNGLMVTIAAFQSFTPAYVVSNGTGGPVNSTLLYSLYVYQVGFEQLRMGYAAAAAWVLVIIIGGLTAIAFSTSRFWVHYGD
ncbi:sugar ABC transporter permease [Pseudolysinimonas kribbensis]|uniref:ABC transporter permease n=1 Tax=Pseudolysinimonas kribbensis TaxID=433641 RepID=A0ABQ6K7E4_9MICO|nr:sugar ABC transporter permease [Pseudolysinimonas kribbensis]GMA94712.1 ABC transporter permease [Pseudolysinimonas kribbensis]